MIVNKKDKFHFIGIGGTGMSALARILIQQGFIVSGSDISRSYVTDKLEKEGVHLFLNHAKENIADAAAVVYSTAVAKENPEFQEAIARGLPLLHRSDFLLKLMQEKSPLLVTGTHGKTTTSSLLAHLLIKTGYDPSFAIGGIVRSIGSNGGHGKGAYFVAEADESDGSFLKYPPFGAIITNIDNDHLDYWKSQQMLLEGFKQFSELVNSEEHFFWCSDDDKLSSLRISGVSYGFGEVAELHIDDYRQEGWKNLFNLTFEGKKYDEIEVPLIGGHNVLNASAVFGLGLRLGIAETDIRRAFAFFEGVNRRAEKKGEENGITVYDDYAHHPTEIFATLRAMKHAANKRRLVVVFQPHRYSRTRDCMAEFPHAFYHADELIMTDIYAAGEAPIEGITTEMLLQKVTNASAAKVKYVPRKELSAFLASFLKKGDILVTMGAGDVTKVGPEILEFLKS